MINHIIEILILSIIAGIAYRMGGSGNYPRWTREVGLCVCMTLTMIICGHLHWTLILCFGSLYGLSTTYFKKKGTDAKWWNWLLVGIAFSIAMLPIVIVQHLWTGFMVRTIVCTGLVVSYQEYFSSIVSGWFYKTFHKDVTDEFGRGFICIATLPLLLIGA